MKKYEMGLKKLKRKIALSFVVSLLLSQGIYAEDTPQELDTITVTAQKIEENVQDVPISMTVFDEFDIEDKRIKTLKDIAVYTPNLMFFSDQNGAGGNPTIRGMVTESASLTSSLGIYIDGVPMIGGSNAIFMDIERIEVLKGPQGTLYGKNSEAGVINIITKKPDNETRRNVGVEFGSDNKREYYFGISGPIIEDKLYIGLSGKHYEKDGLIKNTYKGGQTDDREYNYGKINLRYTPTDNLDISLISQLLQRDDGGPSWNSINATSRENSSNVGKSEPETLLNALKVEYDYNNYKFKSITTYKRKNHDAKRDFDFTPEDKWSSDHDGEDNGFSQEFRVGAQYDGFNWLMGVNAEKDVDERYKWKTKVSTERETDSYGVFAHAEYLLTDHLSLLGGLRYDKNSVDYEETGQEDESISDSEFSPKIGLEYNPNKTNMIYTTVTKGYRAGGVHPYTVEGYSKTYDKETLWSYEVGSKNSFLDNALILNAAIYYMDLDDMQVQYYLDDKGGDLVRTNAAAATSKGFEFDLNYKASANLKLFASFGYNHTEYDEYKDAKGDFSGNTNPMVPEYNYNVGAQYRADQGYYARVDINGYGDMYLDRENEYERDAYNLVNARIGYESENYDIYLYADNLFDKEYDSEGAYGSYVIYSDPREIGIQLSYRF